MNTFKSAVAALCFLPAVLSAATSITVPVSGRVVAQGCRFASDAGPMPPFNFGVFPASEFANAGDRSRTIEQSFRVTGCSLVGPDAVESVKFTFEGRVLRDDDGYPVAGTVFTGFDGLYVDFWLNGERVYFNQNKASVNVSDLPNVTEEQRFTVATQLVRGEGQLGVGAFDLFVTLGIEYF